MFPKIINISSGWFPFPLRLGPPYLVFTTLKSVVVFSINPFFVKDRHEDLSMGRRRLVLRTGVSGSRVDGTGIS